MGQTYSLHLRWVLSGLLAFSCSLEGETKNNSPLSEGGKQSADTSDSGNDDSSTTSTTPTTPTIPIVIPEVYSAGERIGYLLEFDHSSVLKIWDDQNHRFFRINEKTGYLLGVPDHRYYEDNQCTVPMLMISPDPTTCGRGSEVGATTMFAEGGNLSGTIVGTKVLSYSSEMKFRDFYAFREHGDPPCYRDFHPESSKWFQGCMKTTTVVDDGPLFFPLPIEVRNPSIAATNLETMSGSLAESTLRVYSHRDYLGDFAGFRDESIYVYQPSTQLLMGVNQVTGILSGGFGEHLFSDDQCTQDMARSSIWNKTSCHATDESFVPARSEIWSHRGDPEGWKLGRYVLQSTGPMHVSLSLYRAPWNWINACISEPPQCVQHAIKLPDFPLNFPTPIEIRKQNRQ